MDTLRDRMLIVNALRAATGPITLTELAGSLRVTNAVNDYPMPLEHARRIMKELQAAGHAEKVGRHSPARWAFTWGKRPPLPDGYLYRKVHGQYGVYDFVDTPLWSLSGGRLTLSLDKEVDPPMVVAGGHLWHRNISEAQARDLHRRAEAAGFRVESKKHDFCGWSGRVRALVADAPKLAAWVAKEEGALASWPPR